MIRDERKRRHPAERRHRAAAKRPALPPTALVHGRRLRRGRDQIAGFVQLGDAATRVGIEAEDNHALSLRSSRHGLRFPLPARPHDMRTTLARVGCG
jgi:hypothetical protein